MDIEVNPPCTSTMPDDGGDGVNQVNADNAVYPLILSGGKYFTVSTVTRSGNSNDRDNVQATCVKCKTIIKGSLKATSNFRLHLKVSFETRYLCCYVLTVLLLAMCLCLFIVFFFSEKAP